MKKSTPMGDTLKSMLRYGGLTWASWRQNSPTIWLFVQQQAHANIRQQLDCLFNSMPMLTAKKTSKLHIPDPLLSEFTNKRWRIECSAPSHYLNQCRLTIDWNPRNKIQWYSNQNEAVFIREKNSCKNVANKMMANVSVSPCKMCWQHTYISMIF